MYTSIGTHPIIIHTVVTSLIKSNNLLQFYLLSHTQCVHGREKSRAKEREREIIYFLNAPIDLWIIKIVYVYVCWIGYHNNHSYI